MTNCAPKASDLEKKVDVSRLSDFEVSMLIIERDVAQFKTNRIDELLNEYGKKSGLDTEGEEPSTSSVKEETFTTLKFELARGAQSKQ